jgi:hypothetical protein
VKYFTENPYERMMMQKSKCSREKSVPDDTDKKAETEDKQGKEPIKIPKRSVKK